MGSFHYEPILQAHPESSIHYRLLTREGVSVEDALGVSLLKISSEVYTQLTAEAMKDIAFFLRTSHLQQLQDILKDDQASSNDKFVAWELLKNANIASAQVLPSCQDTGTAIVIAKKGHHVLTDFDEERAIAQGVFETYQKFPLRYSQLAPMSMFEEANTKTNLPAQIELLGQMGREVDFLFIAKGGGSANKTFLYQQTKALLQEEALLKFLEEKMRALGTSACPPYHLAVVIGGPSAEFTLKVAKLASTKYLDGLPLTGNAYGRAFRDKAWEEKILQLSQKIGIGAQFGGKYFCHDVRVIRLPRHNASCPVGITVSCSADRQALGKITDKGVFLEALEKNPAQFLPEVPPSSLTQNVVSIHLNQPMHVLLKELSEHPVGTRLSLTGILIVARDMAHARLKQQCLKTGSIPEYFKNHVIYYAGPAKTPQGYVAGSFGPTTAGRMDSYSEFFASRGASQITLAKGNRGAVVTKAYEQYGGFYLGSIGGGAAILTHHSIKSMKCIDFEDLGMEAVWQIEVENFPAFIVVDNKGNNFFNGLTLE